jgi:hypothetical protein
VLPPGIPKRHIKLEGFAVHTNCGMDKNPESHYAHEIAVMRKIPTHNLC